MHSLVWRIAVFIGLLSLVSGSNVFGSKTPYDLYATSWTEVARQADIPPSCQLIHLRFVGRHGTRSLDKKRVKVAQKAIDEIKRFQRDHVHLGHPAPKFLSDRQIECIKSWENQLPTDKQLLERGKAEQHFLARHFYNLIVSSPVLANRVGSFWFESSNKTRTIDSAAAFQAELSRLLANRRMARQPVEVVPRLLYFHQNCPGYTLRVAKNKTVVPEEDRAKHTERGMAIVNKINKEKFGFFRNVLEWKNIVALYKMTAYEMAAFNYSVFMPMFDAKDLEYLEYIDDMDKYWAEGYSQDPVTQQMSCVLTEDIFQTARVAFQKFRTGPKFDDVKNIFGFGHLETLLPIYAALGLFHDPPQAFVADASPYFISTRKYDTSEMGGMASNIAFLFYDCQNYEPPRDRMVLVLVNGRPQPLPKACPFNLMCPLQLVEAAYPLATGLSKCDFQKICSLVQTSSVASNHVYNLLTFIPCLITTVVVSRIVESIYNNMRLC